MDFHLLDRLRDADHNLALWAIGVINGPVWKEIAVPVIVGMVSAAGSSYVTTVKMEERMAYVIKRQDQADAKLDTLLDDKSRVRVVEQDLLRLWDYIKRQEDRGTQSRPR